MNQSIKHVLLFAFFTSLLQAACSNGIAPRDVPTPHPPVPTPTPRELVLPADDGSHSVPIEWWYYNGHLRSETDEEYSFHYVIFQTEGGDAVSRFEFGQAGITDVQRGEHTYISSELSASTPSFTEANSEILLNLQLANFNLEIATDGSHTFSAQDPNGVSGLELATDVPTEVMLHEGIGWMDWPFGWTYYYSYPRMQANGILTIDDRKVDVKGEVWFDHQWGDFFVVGKPAGWQWFAIHLDDGRSLMIAEIRDAEGEVLAIDGTLIQSGSEQRVLDAEQDGIALEVQEYWTSPRTAGEYPAKWRLRVDSINFDVLMTPSIADQEVPALPYGNQAAAYWEGRVEVTEASSGESLGRAFAELSGYAEPEPLSWRSEER